MLDFDQKLDEKIDWACDFIKEALGESPSYVEIDSEEEEKEPLVLDKDLDQFSFKEIYESKPEVKIAAVDGGSATIVKGRSFFIGVHRAGYLIFQEGKRGEKFFSSLSLETVSLGNLKEKYFGAYSKLVGEEPTEAPGLDKILDRLRIFKEWRLVLKLLDELNPDDFLLVDGSLRASIVPPYNFLSYVTSKAKKKNIHLVGITKTSTLYWGKKSPLIPMVVKKSEELYGKGKWYCRLSDFDCSLKNPNWFGIIYVAKLKKASDYAFRVDVNREDEILPDTIFSVLSNLASDPSVLGYPYPLAAIHNHVRITSSEIEDLRYRLQQKALQKGISTLDWDLLFSDFHEVLNLDLKND